MIGLAISWLLSLLELEVSADATATCRSAGLARAEVRYACTLRLNARCYDTGWDEVDAPTIYEPQCAEDGGLWTCTVICSGPCSRRGEDER